MKKLSLSLILVTLCFACATQPTLKDYKAKNLEEDKIISLVVDLEKAYNSYDSKRVLSAHAPGALIKTGMKDDWSGDILTKEEYINIVPDKLAKFHKFNFRIEFSTPEKLFVEGANGKMIVPYKIYSTSSNYYEAGTFDFEFLKTHSGWLITKNTWEVFDCNHPKFKEWKKSQ